MRQAVHTKRSHWIVTGCPVQVIAHLTLPMVPGVLAMLTLDFVDSYLIAGLGTDSLAALGFTVPVTNTLFGLTIGLSIGAVSLISKAMGSRNCHDLKALTTNCLLLTVILGLSISIIAYFTLGKTFLLLGVNYEIPNNISKLIQGYMSVRYAGLVFWMLPMVSIGVFRAVGDTRIAAYLLCAWSLVTLGLDALLVGLGLGMVGLAWGHLLSDVIFSILCFYLLWKRENLIVLPKAFVSNIKPMLTISLPASLTNMLNPIAMGVLTFLIAQSGTQSVAAFGIVSRFEHLLLIVPMALTTSLPVFVGQNWAAGLHGRVKRNIFLAVYFTLAFQLFISVVLWFCADAAASMMSSDDAVKSWIKMFLYIVPFGYGALGVAMITNSALNAAGQPLGAFFLSIGRIFFIYLPCVYAAYLYAGLQGLFFGIATGNILALTIIIFCLRGMRPPHSSSHVVAAVAHNFYSHQ